MEPMTAASRRANGVDGMLAKSLRQIALIGAFGVLSSVPVFAQAEVTYDVGEFTIEGVPAICPEVVTVVRTTGEDQLIYAPDYMTIVINGPAFDQLSPGVRLFLYYHTCAQMFYGDRLGFADRYVVRQGVAQQWLSATALETICETDTLVEAGWPAAPDAERCDAMYQTMRDALP
jgi:hypothetical protein